jgi:thymidine kinase
MSKQGKILFKYGNMSSGKSLLLLATAHNFQEHSIPFLILKSEIDTRDGLGVVHSRALRGRECVSISTSANIYKIINNYLNTLYYTTFTSLKWILVDEAQFLTAKQVEELAAIADNFGINVICYGLRTDFKTNLFEGSKRLFEIADSFEEIKSSCFCNHKTIFNARINSDKEIVTDGNQIEIGGDDKYTSICRKCYFEAIKHPLYIKNENNLD